MYKYVTASQTEGKPVKYCVFIKSVFNTGNLLYIYQRTRLGKRCEYRFERQNGK